jgi:threonyl-tRNA synthetase
MLHRALLGSMERFFAVLTEHYAGAFPTWLAPVQAKIISVTEKQEPWATKVYEELKAKGFRVELDASNDKLGAKIRKAQLEKIPYMLVVGDKEVEAQGVAARTREGAQLPLMTLDAFAAHLAEAAAIPKGGQKTIPAPGGAGPGRQTAEGSPTAS